MRLLAVVVALGLLVGVSDALNCGIGLVVTNTTDNSTAISQGATASCNGECGTVNLYTGVFKFSVLLCDPFQLCDIFGIVNKCGGLANSNVSGCCCNDTDNCNSNALNQPAYTPAPTGDPVTTCFVGVKLSAFTGPIGISNVPCNGDCSIFTIPLTNISVYTCDPIAVCQGLGVTPGDDCTNFADDDGLKVCCCNKPNCNGPNTPTPVPGLMCYEGFGVHPSDNSPGYQKGSSVPCDGYCSTVSLSIAGGNRASVYLCESLALCGALNSSFSCANSDFCCCGDSPNCNAPANVLASPIPTANPTSHNHSVNCFTGFQLSGASPFGYHSTCNGDCALATSGGFGVYLCDATDVCGDFFGNNENQCVHGVFGFENICCCNGDQCNDPGAPLPTQPPPATRLCYVGVIAANYTTGGTMSCSGNCGSIATNVQGVDVTLYACVPPALCSIFGVNETCSKLPFENNITACCCSSTDNCNTNMTNLPTPQPSGRTILCYNGFWVNGQPVGIDPGLLSCPGECASITINTTFLATPFSATLFTCDPATICRGIGIRESCAAFDGGLLNGCCCSEPDCIDPMLNRYPGNRLHTCYSGVSVGSLVAASEQYCDGYCVNATTTVGNSSVAAYFCAPRPLCDSLLLGGTCGALGDDSAVMACCCNGDNCNVVGNITLTTPAPFTGLPIRCYEGFYINNVPLSNFTFPSLCRGSCSSLSFQSTVAGKPYTASIYTCDPADVCSKLSMTNNCNTIGGVITGCCCQYDLCIDPAHGIQPPMANLSCVVGLHIGDNFTYVNTMPCNGYCATVGTTVNSVAATAYLCASPAIYYGLETSPDGCIYLPLDNAVVACFCGTNNCNYNLTSPVPAPAPNGVRIVCYSGIYVNGVPITAPQYAQCRGDCFSATFSSSISGSAVNATIYTCDPSTVCNGLGIRNRCTDIDGGVISGCCCNTDLCIDPSRGINPSNQLNCAVGIRLGQNFSQLSSVPCDLGICATAHTVVGASNTDASVHFCAPYWLYQGLDTGDFGCAILPLDTATTVCFCDSDNCNTLGAPINTNTTDTSPIACYEGISVNGVSLVNRYVSCLGNCLGGTFNTSMGNTSVSASIYMCDPSTICDSINIHNQCANNIDGVSFCCCNSDACIDPSKGVIPGQPSNNTATLAPPKVGLQCVAGFRVGSNFTSAISASCDGGYCAVATTSVNGLSVDAFFCSPYYLAVSMSLSSGGCTFLYTDQAITVCFCGDTDNCNAKGVTYTTPAPPMNPTPITCYSGVSLNGVQITNRYVACVGNCFSATLNATVNGTILSATLYTCDPAAMCKSVGLVNKCSTLAGAVDACCCTYSNCIDPSTGALPHDVNSTLAPPKIGLQCVAGFRVGQGQNYSVGVSGGCDGGFCAVATTSVNSYSVDAFFCSPYYLAASLTLDPDYCANLYTDNAITVCFCGNSDNCNANGITYTTPAPVTNPRPITCYSGVSLNGVALTSRYVACLGNCFSATLNTTYSNISVSATLYTCDPAGMCDSVSLLNKCATLAGAIDACCCNYPDCIDPSAGRLPETQPDANLTCYIGLDAGSNFSSVAASPCSGFCGTATTSFAGVTTGIHFCAPYWMFFGLNASEHECTILPTAQAVTVCFCPTSNCNLGVATPPASTTVAPLRPTPITCYEGILVNGVPMGVNRYSVCYGNCFGVTVNTAMNNTNFNVSLYTCDPAAVCQGLGVQDRCTTIDNGAFFGCCCGYSDCLDPTRGVYPYPPPRNLTCAAGLSIVGNTTFAQLAGISCFGACATATAQVGASTATVYFCANREFRGGLNTNVTTAGANCTTILNDAAVNVCFCGDSDNCNSNGFTVSNNTATQAPILCYEGIQLNGGAGTGGYTACNGACFSATFSTSLAGSNVNATLYTCDPASVCSALPLSNSCGSINGTLSGCCCNYDACVQPGVNPTPPSGPANAVSPVIALFIALLITRFA